MVDTQVFIMCFAILAVITLYFIIQYRVADKELDKYKNTVRTYSEKHNLYITKIYSEKEMYIDWEADVKNELLKQLPRFLRDNNFIKIETERNMLDGSYSVSAKVTVLSEKRGADNDR